MSPSRPSEHQPKPSATSPATSQSKVKRAHRDKRAQEAQPKPRVTEPIPDEPVLPRVSRDERDIGWGDEPDGRRDEEWYRRERPPHHE